MEENEVEERKSVLWAKKASQRRQRLSKKTQGLEGAQWISEARDPKWWSRRGLGPESQHGSVEGTRGSERKQGTGLSSVRHFIKLFVK